MNHFESDWTPSAMFPIVIIGAGMAGITAAFELKRLGINKIILLDKSPAGKEGPWITTARMRHLRSSKELLGPAINFPEFSFEHYYVSHLGKKEWDTLYKIPNEDWENYLIWLRNILELQVLNNETVTSLSLKETHIEVRTNDKTFEASKVIIATGRGGLGGPNYPEWINQLKKEQHAHTSEEVEIEKLKGLKVAIVGTGASGLDAAGAALEAGAKQVDILCRRPEINNVNKGLAVTFSGFSLGYYFLSDKDKLAFNLASRDGLATPPFESLLRIKGYPQLKVIYSCNVVPTEYDFVFLATGYKIDLKNVPYLKEISDQIDIWGNHMSEEEKKLYPYAPSWPYLGQYFELNPFKDIYCFNFGASLSHGNISGDIPAIGIGANRLARGIAVDIFLKYKSLYYQNLVDYQVPEFDQSL